MKKKISICIEEGTILSIEQELSQGLFRSRSHVIEYALTDYLKRSKGEKK